MLKSIFRAVTIHNFKQNNLIIPLLKHNSRFKRVQTRRPVAVYNNYQEVENENYEKKKIKPFKQQQQQQQQKQKPPSFHKNQPKYSPNEFSDITQNIEKNVSNKKSKDSLKNKNEKFQEEFKRVYEEHDPTYSNENISEEIVQEAAEKVAFNEVIQKKFELTKLPDGDVRFGPQIQIAKAMRHRYEKRTILLEGKRLILDAIESGVRLKSIFAINDTKFKELIDAISDKESFFNNRLYFYQVSQRSVDLWSDVETSQGLLAIAKMPEVGECRYKRQSNLPFMLILDQIRDPGNMGTIIRTAAATGCERILISRASVDIWDPKVIRSAMGAHFKIPIIHDLTSEQIESYLPTNTMLLFADNNKNKTDLRTLDYTQLSNKISKIPHVSLIIGNETAGINKKFYSIIKIDRTSQAVIHIPLVNGIESLNCAVASSILCYEIRNTLLKSPSSSELMN